MEEKCINCGRPAAELHHVVPLALGGNDIESNRVWLCSECHTLVHGTNKDRRGTHWKELQRAGIERAKKEGKYKGKKRIEINKTLFIEACIQWRNGERTAKSVYEEFNISSQTFYRRIHEWNL